ncbi:MAG: hypothetical protein OEX76_06280 [Candidatus Bathyarchaeota archaeon]|nr:hypothetical protein [Candidatus Bathyarchaeota archaeon]MDH5713310.1 hypothetical protein [Candidatus Bathyarchaeota archaeon]
MSILERKGERIVAAAALALVVYILSLCLIGQVLSAVQTNRTVSNVGAVKAIGVGVYWDQTCANTVTSIDWGTIEPGSTVNKTCYIRNEGNSVSTLALQTSSWNPSNATDYISLSWDYGGQSVNPSAVVRVTFTLSVSSGIQNITNFSFDITISATG